MTQTSNSKARLSNPLARRPIRDDFPAILSPYRGEDFHLKVIEKELQKHGRSLQDGGKIHVAYPHKHPGRVHVNAAAQAADFFSAQMAELAPSISWIPARALYEKHHLARSENQSAIHALTAKQEFDVDPTQQEGPIPLLDQSSRQKDLFVIVDVLIDQGTTMANMMNYIEHNGGAVLAVHTQCGAAMGEGLKQGPSKPMLRRAFNDAALNSGRLPDLGMAFAKSALGKMETTYVQPPSALKQLGERLFPSAEQRQILNTAARCLEEFQAALLPHGSSLQALTDGECQRLIYTVRGVQAGSEETDYRSLLQKLKDTPPVVGPQQNEIAPIASFASGLVPNGFR